LPTDAEWEWAARGGVSSQDFIYSGSDEVNEVSWYFGSFVGEGTKAVGTKLANELDIHDMSGNVFEWCWDLRGLQPPQRSIRGGCWAYHADECAVRCRASAMPPDVRVILVGFRVARNATQ
jgi:formylglycine-generating enzyme required for sulfatase activity